MRLTAAEKAIGALNMRKADIERAQLYLEKGEDLTTQLADIERCIELLHAMQIETAPKPRKPRAVKGKRKESAA
jgi:hypothetical protein